MLRINNATNALTYVGALTDVERITRKARDARAALGDILGETLVTPGDARVTQGDTKEPTTAATRSSSKTATTAVLKSSRSGHSSGAKNTHIWNMEVTC